MAFVPLGNTVRAFLEFSNPTPKPKGYVLHFRQTSGFVTVGTMEGLADVIVPWFDLTMQSLMTAGYALTRIRMRDMSSVTGAQFDRTAGLPLTGTLAGNSLPSQVCLAIALKSGVVGRSYNGRVYHMGLSEDVVSGNTVTSLYLSDVVDAWNQLKLDTDADGTFEWVVASTFSDGEPRLEGVTTRIESAVATDSRVDTQRRRLN